MNSSPRASTATLDGIEDKWTRVWDKECVVQV